MVQKNIILVHLKRYASLTHKMTSRNLSAVAVCQMKSTADVNANFETCRSLIRQAKAAKALMVFLPEGCDYIGTSQAETLALATTEDGQLIERYREVAKESNIWISLGGVHIRSKNEGKLSNSAIVIDAQGDIIARYDKTHLFDVDIPEKQIRLMESAYVERGSAIVPPIPTPVGRLGLEICYDMRFPELSLSLRQQGAQILTFPSAFTFDTGASHWQTLLSARAIESQCYVIAAAQTGTHSPKRRSWGHAMVVDPWGTVIAQCSQGTGFALANIDLNFLENVRKGMPVMEHRRYDLYPKMPAAPHVQEIYQFGQVTVPRKIVFLLSGLSFAFTNKRCMVPGHVLVAPIRQALRVSDLTSAEVADLFQMVQKVETLMEKITGAESSTIVVQDGPDAGQTIRHVHVHILPRKPGDFQRNDDIYTKLQEFDKDEEKPWRTEEEMAAEAAEIKKYLDSVTSELLPN